MRWMLLSLVILGALAGGSAEAADAGAPALPPCIAVSTESRWVPYGYNHLVILKSSCKQAATCTVSTDVNPQPQTAEVAAGATVEVSTFMASPAASFVAKAACQLH